MSGHVRAATGLWVVVFIAGLSALVLGIQYASSASSFRLFGASSVEAAASDGAGDPAASNSLADLARHGRELQSRLLAMREQLATTQKQVDQLAERTGTLDAMLAGNSLTQCPVFLQDESTVRALQGIIREAIASETPGTAPNGLDTAATIARSRLRRRLEMIREDLLQQSTALQQQAETLRGHIREKTTEIEAVEKQIRRRLSAAEAATPEPRA